MIKMNRLPIFILLLLSSSAFAAKPTVCGDLLIKASSDINPDVLKSSIRSYLNQEEAFLFDVLRLAIPKLKAQFELPDATPVVYLGNSEVDPYGMPAAAYPVIKLRAFPNGVQQDFLVIVDYSFRTSKVIEIKDIFAEDVDVRL